MQGGRPRGGVDGGGDGPAPTLRARSVLAPPGPPWCRTSQIAASWPKRARFQSYFYKVSQNGVVSTKSVEKAYHSPCFQNPVEKSPLEILRFPFSRSFSHKELMGHFDPSSEFIVKMTKCRQLCTPLCTRSGRQIPPRTPAASCLLVSAPHLTQRGTSTVFSTDWFLTVS